MNKLKGYWSVNARAHHGRLTVIALTAGALLVTLFLAGCGSEGESTGKESSSTTSIEGVSDEQLDAAVERTKSRVKDALKAQGVGSETQKGGYAVGAEHDGESVSMGVDLDAPAWLPAKFPLPEDLSISMVSSNTRQARSELLGSSTRVKQTDIAERAAQWAARNNWEVIRSTDVMLTLANSDGRVLDVRADDGAQLEIRLSRRDLAHDRQQVAVERKGPGSAEITMAGDARTVPGECLIKGSSYQFEYTASDGSVFATLQIQSVNNTPTGSASFITNGQDGFAQFNINFPMDDDNGPVVTTSGDTFSVRGTFFSMGGGGVSAVDGSMSVNCEF